jgi:hypothetical protein
MISLSSPGTELTAVESFVWHYAQHWRDPGPIVEVDRLDWPRVMAIARPNRVQVLIHKALVTAGALARLPASARTALEADAASSADRAALLGEALRQYLQLAAEGGLQAVPLKGLLLSAMLYGDPAVRPGEDIDLLVPLDQVRRNLAILERMGLGQWWPNLLSDAYYERHHLHLQRCSPDLRIWFEIHWALDHPYTLLTADYAAMIERALPSEWRGQPLRWLAGPDLLLSLALHLVRHAIYLPSVLGRADLPRLILADGMLIQYVDITEVIKLYQDELDWPQVVALARQWGAVDILGAVLQVCRHWLSAPIPDWVLEALPVRGPGRATRWAMNEVANYARATFLGQERNRFWDLMVITNGAFILRPIRILDTLAYWLPDADFMQRRYGAASWRTALGHLVRAVRQYAVLSADSVYYAWERRRRLKALKQNTSLWNRLDTQL